MSNTNNNYSLTDKKTMLIEYFKTFTKKLESNRTNDQLILSLWDLFTNDNNMMKFFTLGWYVNSMLPQNTVESVD